MELLIYLLAIILYFVPTYIAIYRNANGKSIIFILNILIGWTFVAWILLIVVALSINKKEKL